MKEIEKLQEELDEVNNLLIDSNRKVRELESDKEELEEQIELNNTSYDNIEDCRRSLFFSITELEEVERGDVSLSDKLER